MHLFLSFQSNVADIAEDDITIKRHIETLKAEALKVVPDEALIECKMERTFNYRKSMLHSPETCISDVLAEFPVLRQRNFVSIHCIFYLFTV